MVEAFDPANGFWSSKTDMPTPRYDMAVGVIDGLVYVAGGTVDGRIPLNTFEVYNPGNNTWTRKASMPTARYGARAGVVDGLLYVVGGVNATAGLNTVEVYDPDTDRWTGRAPMRRGRTDFGIGVVSGRLYAFGGGLSSDPQTVEAYDPATNSWSDRARMPAVRTFFGVGVINGIIYAVGGLGSGSSNARDLDAYDPATNRWTTVAQLPTPRMGPGTAATNGVLYVVGGLTSGPPAGAKSVALNEALDFHVSPSINPGGVVNGASFRPASDSNGSIAPGTIVSIFGNSLADDISRARFAPLPNVLGGVRVAFDKTVVPIFLVSPQQINVQAPFELNSGTVSVEVWRANRSSAPQTVSVADVSPGIFMVDDRHGAIQNAETYQVVDEDHPVHPGDHLVIWCTGLGRLTGSVKTGSVPASPSSLTVVQPEVRIGDFAADVMYSGSAPGFVGVYQVNVRLPAGVFPGTHNLQLFMNGVPSNSVTVVVKE